MPLLTENQQIDAAHIESSRIIASHLAAAINEANQIVQRSLDLDDAELTSWINSHPPQEQMENFAAHGQLGQALNTASTIAGAVLVANGVNAPLSSVDIRSVAEKLASAGRQLSFENGVFSVTTPAPEPQPE